MFETCLYYSDPGLFLPLPLLLLYIKFCQTNDSKFIQPSYMFTDKEHRGTFEFSDELGNLSINAESGDSVVPAQRVEENDKDLLLSTTEKDDVRDPGSNGSAYNAPSYNGSAPSASATSQPLADLAFSSTSATGQAPASISAIDDLLGFDFSVGTATTPPPPPLTLNPKAVLDPGTFQQKWRQLPISLSEVCFEIIISVFLIQHH